VPQLQVACPYPPLVSLLWLARMRPKSLPLVLFLFAALVPASLLAQNGAEIADGLRVYFECSRGGGGCDQRELRTQIDWVNWMRDRQDAQLHVIVTNQATGSGGRRYSFDFIGLDEFDGVDDQLAYSSFGTDVRDETVRGMTRVLTIGLARYAVLSGSTPPVDFVRSHRNELVERLVTSDEVSDPWDFWVFEVDFDMGMNGESSRKNRNLRGGVEASRTTPTWKIEFGADGNWRRNEIQLSDTTIVDDRRDWEVGMEAIYALADHWSVGSGARVSAATRTNQNLSVSIGPKLEYSVWPYEEQPRRSLRVRYEIGVRHFRYEKETLFGETEETRPIEELSVSISQRQPWGFVFANAEASHYLHDLGKYRIGTRGRLSFRVLRGLNLNVDGDVSWIRDQLFLAAEDISDEDRLLQRRRLASNFDWDFGVGFSFQFGSIFNNVVNNRF
jgi:hypothetical protein